MDDLIKEVDATIAHSLELRAKAATTGAPWIGVLILGARSSGLVDLGGSDNLTRIIEAIAAMLARDFGPGTCPMGPSEPSKLVWGYASDPEPETWSGSSETRDEALEEARENLEPGTPIYLIPGREPTLRELLPNFRSLAEMVCDGMSEAADELVGEVADDFPGETPEARRQLEQMLEATVLAWAKANVTPHFYVTAGKGERAEPLPAAVEASDAE